MYVNIKVARAIIEFSLGALYAKRKKILLLFLRGEFSFWLKYNL